MARAERVAQVRAGHPTIGDHAAYFLVDGAVAMLHRRQDAGAQIDYLSLHRNQDDVALDAFVLREHGLPMGRALARKAGESYGDVAGREAPDVLIEDDRERIWADQITYRRYRPTCALASSPIVVPEFGGLNYFPDSPRALLTFEP